jgi:hypothetical protein
LFDRILFDRFFFGPGASKVEGLLRNILRNNGMPGYCYAGVVSPDSVLTTAEDGLLVIPRQKNAAAELVVTPPLFQFVQLQQYSGERCG